MEIGIPKMTGSPLRTTSVTRINLVKSSIPQTLALIMDLAFLSLGVILNLFVIVVIFSRAFMRTATNYYLVSLACSNMVILLEPLQEILRWFFLMNNKPMNMDYICLISFDVSVITIAVLKFQLYINVFRQHTFLGKKLQCKLMAIKGISLIWSASIISIAIGLHIYDYYEGDMADIYVWNTFLFIILPFLIFLALDCLILYNLMIFKAIDGSWRSKELGHYIMLVVITVAFLLIRTPYRVARAINFIWPKLSCCTDSTREILFFIAKSFPAVFSIIYMASSNEFHRAFKKTDT